MSGVRPYSSAEVCTMTRIWWSTLPRRQRRTTQPECLPDRLRGIKLNVEILEDRCVPATYRSIDGTGNNAAHPECGSTNEALLRIAAASYAVPPDGNGFSTPGGVFRPSPRLISNTVVDQGDADIISDRMLSAMIYAWGQFIDHDMDLTNGGNPAEPFNILIPQGDPFFDPTGSGTQIMPFSRS